MIVVGLTASLCSSFRNKVAPPCVPGVLNFDTTSRVLFPLFPDFFFIGKKLRGFKDCLIHLANPREAPPTSNCCFKASLFSQLCLKLSTNIWINRRLPACWRCFRNAANSLFSTAAFIQRPLSSVTLKKGRVLLGINQIPPQNWSGNRHDFNKIRAFRKLQLPWNIKQRSGQQGRTSSYLVIDKLSDGTAFFLKRLQVCKRDFHVPSLVPQTVWSVEGLWGAEFIQWHVI